MKKAIETSGHFLANQLHILFIILTSVLTQPLMAQDSTYINYLQQNLEKINIGGINRFAIFDDNFYNNQLFLVSESHGYAKPHQLDAELFMQINKKNGVRYYLAEVDFSQAYYLNQYLTTGEETLLEAIYQNWFDEKAQWGCKAGFEKWKTLYQYNQALPKGKKIIVLGLDNAQNLDMNVQLLTQILTEAKYKKGSNAFADSLSLFVSINLKKDSSTYFKRFCSRLAADINSHEAAYKKLLKSKYFDFKFIINNIASKQPREEKIFANFNTFYNEYKLTNEKLYGFWGRFHSMQDSINGDMSFAAMLKNSQLSLKDKIISIPVFCIASTSMIPTAFLPPMAQQKGTIFSKVDMVNDDSFVYTVAGIKIFSKLVGKNESILFKLDAAGSPYRKGLNLVESNSQFDKTFNWTGNKQSATTHYFQYAIVVSNSDWAAPYGDNKVK